MNARIRLARFLLRLAKFLESLPVVVLRPADMIEWSRRSYNRNAQQYGIGNDVDQGLSPDETMLWQIVPVRTGRVLILGGGGGREAIFFARQGWQITVLDFSEHMLELAQTSMAERGLAFESSVSEIAHLQAPAATFDLVWISMFLYSVVLKRSRRIETLRRIRATLKSEGYLVCSFHWQPQAQKRGGSIERKIIAWLTLGNTGYENGDILFGMGEFRHAFASEAELHAEFLEGGFDVVHLAIFDELLRGGAVLKSYSLENRQVAND
jgi:ubiquinone/menaquinone biosynthesis C-methylase UbiE